MPIEQSAVPSSAADETWFEIEDLVEHIAGLSTSDVPQRAFYTTLLDRAIAALAAAGGAVWVRNAAGALDLEYQVNLARTSLPHVQAEQRRHALLLDATLRGGEPRVSPPHSGAGNDGDAGNPTEFLLVLGPVVLRDQGVAVVELFQRPVADPTAQRGYLRLMAALCELAADFHQRRELSELSDRQAVWDRLEQFSRQVHGSLDLRPTAYTLANDGREVIECDRVSVLTVRGKRCRVQAVSGLEKPERRSNSVRLLEELASSVVATDEPLWFPDATDPLPPQIDGPLHAYLDESHARTIAVLPIHEQDAAVAGNRRPRTVAALIIERFDAAPAPGAWRQRVEAVAGHGAVALRNAIDYERLPLLPVMRGLRRLVGLTRPPYLSKTLLVVGSLIAIAAALAFIPADFEIEGRGELLPMNRRDVFAPTDGDVRELNVEHGDLVDPQSPGKDLLLVLRKPQLDFEASRVAGEIQTARKRLSAVQAARLGTNRTGRDDPAKYNELTAEEEELKEKLKSLEEQAAILKAQQAELRVRAPIAGQVLTWDLDQLLAARPVQRGQTLMTIADVAGPWVLELDVPDDQIGHILEAQQGRSEPLDVSFLLATDPGVTYRGTIARIAETTEEDPEEKRPTVLVTVDFDAAAVPGKRPGASVIAKVNCGRAPLGYVWLHELFEAIQSRILF